MENGKKEFKILLKTKFYDDFHILKTHFNILFSNNMHVSKENSVIFVISNTI